MTPRRFRSERCLVASKDEIDSLYSGTRVSFGDRTHSFNPLGSHACSTDPDVAGRYLFDRP